MLPNVNKKHIQMNFMRNICKRNINLFDATWCDAHTP